MTENNDNPSMPSEQEIGAQIQLQSIPSAPELNQQVSSSFFPPMEEEMEIVQQTKERPSLNQEEIIRLYREQMEKEQIQRLEVERKIQERKKAKAMLQKNSKIGTKRASTMSNQETKGKENTQVNSGLSQKSLKIKARIQKLTQQYKTMYRPSVFDSKLQRYRFQCKEKLFTSLCIAVQQMLSLSQAQLSQPQKDILALFTTHPPKPNHPNMQIFHYCKRIALELDVQMLKVLNTNRGEITRQYKTQWQTLLNHCKDEGNTQLRRRLVNRQLDVKKVPVANEMQFYTQARRDEVIEKEKRYIAEFTVERADNSMVPNDELIDLERPRRQSADFKIQPSKPAHRISKGKNKYIEEGSLVMLQELIGDGQLEMMRKRLEEDLNGKCREITLHNFKSIFGM